MFIVSVGLVVIGAAAATVVGLREAPRFARWYRHAHHA